mgnify:CR=1 FL=1
MGEVLVPVAVITALIILNAIFVAAEFAILAAPRTRMEYLALRGHKAAALVHYVQSHQARQDAYVATAQLGISAASVGLGMYGEHVIADWVGLLLVGRGWVQAAAAHAIAAPIAVLLLSYLHVVLGEMIPKSLALFHPVKTAVGVSYPMLWIQRLTYPGVWTLNSLGNLLLRLLRIPVESEAGNVHSLEELEIVVEQSHQTGAIGEEEAEIMVNLLHFSDLQVRKVMVPRTRVIGIERDAPFEEVLRLVIDSRHTRYPVCDDGLDHIVGMLHVKELLKELRRHPDEPRVALAMREAVFVPEQMPVEKLLTEFRAHRSQVAIVIDEYGGVQGLVTLTDILEEVVGDVAISQETIEPQIVQRDDGSWLLDGLVSVQRLADLLGIALLEDNARYETLGGFVMSELGRIPTAGDSFTALGFRFEVMDMDGHRVDKMLVMPAPLTAAPE